MLILFVGPSGSGKSTLLKNLCDVYSPLKPAVRTTTREKRDSEIDGVDYHFISLDEYKRLSDEGSFVEWEEYSDNRFYATSYEELQSDDKIVCSTITPSGLLQLVLSGKNFGDILVVNCTCSLKDQILRYSSRILNFTVEDKMEMCDRMARDEGMFKGIEIIIKAAEEIYYKKHTDVLFVSKKIDTSEMELNVCTYSVADTIKNLLFSELKMKEFEK